MILALLDLPVHWHLDGVHANCMQRWIFSRVKLVIVHQPMLFEVASTIQDSAGGANPNGLFGITTWKLNHFTDVIAYVRTKVLYNSAVKSHWFHDRFLVSLYRFLSKKKATIGHFDLECPGRISAYLNTLFQIWEWTPLAPGPPWHWPNVGNPSWIMVVGSVQLSWNRSLCTCNSQFLFHNSLNFQELSSSRCFGSTIENAPQTVFWIKWLANSRFFSFIGVKFDWKSWPPKEGRRKNQEEALSWAASCIYFANQPRPTEKFDGCVRRKNRSIAKSSSKFCLFCLTILRPKLG